jgi:hypothetical protein
MDGAAYDPQTMPEEVAGPVVDPGMAAGSFYPGCGTDCDACCFAPCCCGPTWTVRAGAMALQRISPASGKPNINNFNRHFADFGVGWGYELDAIRHRVCGSGNDVEVRYFGLYGWGGSTNGFTYGSQLQNAEVNVRRWALPWLQVLGGFRWVELMDYLGDTTGIAQFRTRNNLYGGQIGFDAKILQRRRLRIDGLGKAGAYGNNASSTLSFPTLPGFAFGGAANQTAFVGEIGLTGRYAINKHLALRSTYELLWLDGVALANNSLFLGPGVTSNTVFYQGAFVGLEFSH